MRNIGSGMKARGRGVRREMKPVCTCVISQESASMDETCLASGETGQVTARARHQPKGRSGLVVGGDSSELAQMI
jgi:hypothetical protein